MAGDWIKFELATIDKPEVIRMGEVLGMHVDEVVGKLLRVWAWFDQQSRDGNAGGVTGVTLRAFLDRYVGRAGFADSMVLVGWLGEGGIPNFERHNGESAKNRALTSRRVKRHRNDDSVTKALPEKRREEKRLTTGVCELETNPPTNQVSSSTKTRAGRPKANGYSADAYELLAFLNERAGKNFRPVAANLKLIDARLSSGVPAIRVKQVILRKWREWKDRPEMHGYLRPETLFGSTKFEQYLGEIPSEALFDDLPTEVA